MPDKEIKELVPYKPHPLVKQPEGPAAAIGLIGLAAQAGVVGAGLTGAALFAASLAIGLGTALAAGALVKPPKTKVSQNGGGGVAGTRFQSVRNQARPYQPVPEIFGKMRVYPDVAADAYSEQVGSDTWARMLFTIGKAGGGSSYQISEVKIGETAITSYAGDYEIADGYITDADVQAIYPNDVAVEGTLPVQITYADSGLIKTTQANTTEISVDVGCPNGLSVVYDSGKFKAYWINYSVQYRVNDPQGSWQDFTTTDEAVDLDGADQYVEVWAPYDFDITISGTWSGTITTEWSTGGIWTTFGDSYTSNQTATVSPSHDSVRVGFATGNYTSGTASIAVTRGPNFSQRGFSDGLVSWNHRVTGLDSDTYDVRVVRISPDPPISGTVTVNNDFYWMALRSINTGQDAVTDVDDYLLALRIKITGNFNGIVDIVNCIVERKLEWWDSGAWQSAIVTRSPAWVFAHVARKFLSDSKVNGDDLATWATNCLTNGFSFDGIVNGEKSAKDLLEDIAAIGRASRSIVDGVHTVIEDVAQASNLFHYSPRNSWGYSGHRDFIDIPHAFRCRYIDENNGYQPEEIVVCDDGYYDEVPSSTVWAATTAYDLDDYVTDTGANGYYYRCTVAGTSGGSEPTFPTTPRDTVTDGTVTWMCYDAATEYEGMEFWGAIDPDHVWKLGRYHFAVGRLRPETFAVNVGAENLRNTRGDRGGLTYDIMKVGLGQARIKAIDGSDVAMDDTITMAIGSTYGAIVRKADGTFLSTTISTDVGEQSTVTLGSVSGIAVGDLMFFGETDQITQDCIIKGIEYGDDLSAKVTLTNYDEDIYTADSSTIPTYSPVISNPPPENRVPPTPTIQSVNLSLLPVTDSDLSVIKLRATVSFYLGMSTSIEPYYFQTQYRSYQDVGGIDAYSQWSYAADVPIEARHVEIDVENGVYYDFRIRSVSKFGITSPWSTYSDYEVAYLPNAPNDITGFGVVIGGIIFSSGEVDFSSGDVEFSDESGAVTWYGRDLVLAWNEPYDLWRVRRYKLQIWHTDTMTLLSEDWLEKGRLYRTYGFDENYEDTDGSPVGDLTCRIWAESYNGDLSDNYAEVEAEHVSPTAVTGLSGISFRNGVIFTWDDIDKPAFTHFLFRFQVETDGWSSWISSRANSAMRQLTGTEVTAHGATATIYIEVKSVDCFGGESAASSTNESAGGLDIQPTDIDDFAITASKLFVKIPVIQNLSLTDDSPGAGSVAWSACDLYYNGTLYSIAGGNTSYKYIYWKDLASTFSSSDTHPGSLGTWDPEEDHIIAVNISGTGQKAWNAIANQVIGSAYIASAAINDLHVNDVAADKITGQAALFTGNPQASSWLTDVADNTYGMVNYTAISGGKIVLGSSGTTGSLSLDFLDGSTGTLTISSSGNLAMSAGGSMSISTGCGVYLSPDDSTGAKIVYEDSGAGTYDVEILRHTTNDRFHIRPTTDKTCELHLGYSTSNRFGNIYLQGSDTITINANDDTDEAILSLNPGVGTSISFVDSVNGTIAVHLGGAGTISVQTSAMIPYAASTDIGASGNRFDYGYFNTVNATALSVSSAVTSTLQTSSIDCNGAFDLDGGVVTIDHDADAGYLVTVNNTNSGSATYGLHIDHSANSGTGGFFLYCENSTEPKFRVTGAGTCENQTGDYNTISDIRQKENISDATDILDKLMSLRVRNYNLRSDKNDRRIGLITQEIEDIIPDLVAYKNESEPNYLRQTRLIFMLLKGLQELTAEVRSK